MTEKLLHSLNINETDVEGALYRLADDEALYISLLRDFAGDQTMPELEAAITNKQWDEAFTAAHALKGLAGNMGFTPLFHSIGELVILIRAGRIDELEQSFENVRRCYTDIITVINNNL